MTDPIRQFEAWLAEAAATEANDPNACALATVDLAGGHPRPDVRMVLLKGVDGRGFVFFTNYESAKGRQLRDAPFAALDFHWKTLRKQVRVQGEVVPVAAAESDGYFATRARASQLSAWASLQSEPLRSRADFEARLAEMDRRFPDVVPRPPHWGGFRLVPEWIELWQDRPGRQHQRRRFTRMGDDWESTLLYP